MKLKELSEAIQKIETVTHGDCEVVFNIDGEPMLLNSIDAGGIVSENNVLEWSNTVTFQFSG